jgi:hypothetical protein
MILLIILRILLLSKWIFQAIGIILPIWLLWWPREKELIALFSITLLIIPELFMGCALWISKGVSSVYKMRASDEKSVIGVAIFGRGALAISFCFYVAIVISIALLIGGFIELPILCSGLGLLFCLACHKKLKKISDKYLNVHS